MKKAAIIHGTRGTSQGNWFQDVAAQLNARGFHALVPQFPTPEGQNLDNWLTHFKETIGELDQQTLLIGHSVGAVFTLRILEQLDTPISTAVLVAGFTGALGLPEYDILNSTFLDAPFSWNKIRSNAAHIICLSGSNDPYVPIEQGRWIADSLNVEHMVVKGGGHLNAEFGYTNFPLLIEELTKLGIFGNITN